MAFDCVDHNKLWEILKDMGKPDHLTCFLRNLYAGHEASVCRLKPDLEQQTSSKWERGTSRLYCHPAYLTYMQSTSYQMLGWMKHKLESRNINNLRYAVCRYAVDTTLMAESKEKLESLLIKVKAESEKLA